MPNAPATSAVLRFILRDYAFAGCLPSRAVPNLVLGKIQATSEACDQLRSQGMPVLRFRNDAVVRANVSVSVRIDSTRFLARFDCTASLEQQLTHDYDRAVRGSKVFFAAIADRAMPFCRAMSCVLIASMPV
jgi:hypothetical protein